MTEEDRQTQPFDAVGAAQSVYAAEMVRLALRAFSLRAARWLGLVLTFSLYGYTVLDPTWQRIVAASLFAVLVNLPLWWKAER